MAFPPKPGSPPMSGKMSASPVAAAKSKFMAGEREPDVGDPNEGTEGDPADQLSPAAQAVLQKCAEEGVVPTMDDLVAQGLGEDEAMAVLDILDALGEGPVEPADAGVDKKQGFRPGA